MYNSNNTSNNNIMLNFHFDGQLSFLLHFSISAPSKNHSFSNFHLFPNRLTANAMFPDDKESEINNLVIVIMKFFEVASTVNRLEFGL